VTAPRKPAPDTLRDLPSIPELIDRLGSAVLRFPHALLVREARSGIDEARTRVLSGDALGDVDALANQVIERLERYRMPSLRPVVNATGVVLHTNLGRAPLGAWQPIAGYTNLEYDLTTGRRGKRDAHINRLFETLLGKPAIAVNNGAAATFLALNELAAGYEVVVSRGELIEIGDGFRIPDILARSGAVLREVGTTNRTRIEDYREAINDRTRLLLRVHPSNFRITGFTAKPSLQELAGLGRELHIPVYEDLGSGNMIDLRPWGIAEPLVTESLAAGANLVSFSGDKMLGGPQAGILAGDAELVARLRRNPLFRALRLDKLIYQALEDTLRKLVLEEWDAIPALRMIRMTAEEIGARAERLLPEWERIPGESVVGGGSTPDRSIPTTLVVAATRALADAEQKLRLHSPPVIARISQDRLLIDLRTVFPEEEGALREAMLSETVSARSL
jgi:L-seryl-tRNA(Ser) seleniumtransferase